MPKQELLTFTSQEHQYDLRTNGICEVKLSIEWWCRKISGNASSKQPLNILVNLPCFRTLTQEHQRRCFGCWLWVSSDTASFLNVEQTTNQPNHWVTIRSPLIMNELLSNHLHTLKWPSNNHHFNHHWLYIKDHYHRPFLCHQRVPPLPRPQLSF